MRDQTDTAAEHDTSPVVNRLLRENTRLRADCAAAQAEVQQKEQALASVRGLVRSALIELDERARANAAATVTLADVRAQVVFGLSELVAFAGESLSGQLEQGIVFDDPGLAKWVQAGQDDARVKMIVGVRGANKTGVLRAVRNWLRTRGVEGARLVDIDFEDVRSRHLLARLRQPIGQVAAWSQARTESSTPARSPRRHRRSHCSRRGSRHLRC